MKIQAKTDDASDVECEGCSDVRSSLSQRDNSEVSVPVYVDPEILSAFMDMFERVVLPPPGLRIGAAVKDRQSELDQILRRCVESDTGCWEWQGAATTKGYGRVKIGRKLYGAHRVVAWAMGIVPTMGDPDRQVVVMHACDNPRCCNPAHLSMGTYSENMIDCAKKGRIPHQKNPWKPKQPRTKKAAIAESPVIRAKSGKWILTPKV